MSNNITKHAIINGLLTIVLIAIIINQGFWISNVYILHQRELKASINKFAQEAVFKELAVRSEAIGGVRFYSEGFAKSNDTSRYVVKQVSTKDSTYTITIDTKDSNVVPKISQLLLKNDLPIDLSNLKRFFDEMISYDYNIVNTYFDYIDLESRELIKTNQSTNTLDDRYMKTDTIPLDILNSIGVVGYVKVSTSEIIDRMIFQLLLSLILIVIGTVSLFFISRSFIFQWKTEKMRQDSVNAMTHEFKRPISSVVAMSSLIPFYIEKEETGKVLEYSNNIQLELNKLTHYTTRIQQISNNEKGSLALNKTKIAIFPFFESLKQRYNLSGESDTKTSVNLEIATSIKEMCVDLLHFSNVMDNLIENAIKYSVKPVVEIDIKVTDVSEGLSISVKDNGIGISYIDKKHIFDKFYRVKRAETKDRMGFGLGLTYVKSIVDAHDATIAVVSKLNEGSEFIITLKE